MNNIYEKTVPMPSSEVARTKENNDIEILGSILIIVVILGFLIGVDVNLIPELKKFESFG